MTLDGWALDDGAPARVNVLTVAPPRSRLPLARIAGAVLVLAAAAWALHDVEWSGLWRVLTAARPAWLVAAAAVNLGAVAFQAARWHALARPLSPTATLGAAFRSLILGFALSLVVPARAGELLRIQSFSRRTGLPPATVVGSIVLDYLVNAAGLLLCLAVLAFVVPVPPWMRQGAFLALSLFATGAVLVLAVRTSAGMVTGRLASLLSRLRRGVTAGSSPRALGTSLVASLASWVLEVEVAFLALAAVGLVLPYSAAFLVLLAVNLSLAVPVATPGNIGPVELAATFTLVGLGVAKEQALAFAVAYHALQILPVALLGLFFASQRLEG